MRPQLLKTYKAQVVTYLKKRHELSDEEAEQLATKICRENYKPLTAVIEETKVDGCPVIKAVDLAMYFDQNRGNMMSPSGSIYLPHATKLSRTISMILDKLDQRSKYKKAMFKAKTIMDFVMEMIYYYLQTLTKININSLPGNYGSPYSVFYSKGNYNAITSTGRALIGYANSEIEAVLGGNFAWFSQNELAQHIIGHVNHGIDKAAVKHAMDAYGLKYISKTDLLEFFKKNIARYVKVEDWTQTEKLIDTLDEVEVQYFWYLQNLRHIVMGNDGIFRKYLDDMFDISKVEDTCKDPEELFKVNGALVTFCNIAFHDYVDPGDPEIQVYDLPKVRPDLATKFVSITKYVAKKLEESDEFFDVFIRDPICRTDVQHRKLMLRNSAVISDTDSVIFTVKDWVEWYTGNVYSVDASAYNVACLAIYWITKAIEDMLRIACRAHGASEKFENTMVMKNEFLYPSMILADMKKHYAGIIKVQEGVILPKPETDIKGVNFKGSDICKEAIQNANKFITNSILNNIYSRGRICGHELIAELVQYENQIRQDLLDGKTDWFEPLSIKNEKDYETPMSSNWYYWYAWQQIFAEKYGDLQIPDKIPAVPILKPSAEYFENLKRDSPDIYRRFKEFLENNPRCPSKFVINPVKGRIPPELIPLINITSIISANVRPCHLILRQINAAVGFESVDLLYRDVYDLTPNQKD